jgi:hypothetical protein
VPERLGSSPRIAAVAVLALAAGVAGCGGSDSKTTSSSTTAAATGGTVTTKQVLRAQTPGKASKSDKSKKQPKPTSTVEVSEGDVVAVATVIPLKKGEAPPNKRVKVTIQRGPASTLATSAGGTTGGPTSHGKITSKSGKIKAVNVRYGCAVPPQATFCPVDATLTNGTYELVGSAPKKGPLVFNLMVKGA